MVEDGFVNRFQHKQRSCSRNWIITGCTGFIGRELIYFLLTTTQDRLTLLIRPSGTRQQPIQRIAQLLAEIDHNFPVDWNRLDVISSDVTLPMMGLSDTTIESFQQYDNIFVHLAANTNFAASIDVARTINLQGTRHALALATRLSDSGSLSVFGYVSTCFVHGGMKGVVDVNEPLRPESTRNAYERSKCETEQEVRAAQSQLPIVIIRPSIVVGDSANGRAYGTNTMYWATKHYLGGHRRFLARADTPLDIVPVDFVVSTMCFLLRRSSYVGGCYPLASGVGRDITVGHFAKQIAHYYCLPAATLIDPGHLSKAGNLLTLASASIGKRSFMRQMFAYLPYFTGNPQFDISETVHALGDIIGRAPHFDSYCDKLFEFCLDKGWTQNIKLRQAS